MTLSPSDAPHRTTDASAPAADLRHTATLGESPPFQASEPPRPAIPGYEITGLLGRGAMGVVYRARRLALQREVALKMILAGAHASPQEVARFRVEAEAAARLQHPNIVQVFEVGEHDGLPYCALELVEGGSLAQRLRERPLALGEAARLVAALAEAVHLAHSRNVVHRDLKPANILLAADGTPKVADFGLARRLDVDGGGTQTGALVGTPAYMAPEQAQGQAGAAGPAADTWALGAILYECLTGRPPFAGATVLETVEQVRSREPAPPSRLQPGVPRDLETICLKCLRKEPEQRYSSARELAEDLARFLRGEPVLARPLGTLGRLAKWARRRPAAAALWLAAVLLTVLTVGASVALLSFQSQAEAARAEAADVRAAQDRDAAQQAREREQQVQEKERLTRESLEQVEDALAENLMRPVGFGKGGATPAEIETLRDLAASPSERLRLRFIEKALAKPPTAERLARRADEVAQAVVGLDPARRAQLTALLVERLRDPTTSREARAACIALGDALEAKDAEFAQVKTDAARARVADALERMAGAPNLAAMWDLAMQMGREMGPLPPEEAEQTWVAADRLLFGALNRTDDPNAVPYGIDFSSLMNHLPAADAPTVPRRLLLLLDHPINPNAFALWYLPTGLQATADRLSDAEAVAAARARFDRMDRSADPFIRAQQICVVTALAPRLPPDERAAAFRKVLAAFARTDDPKCLAALVEGLNRWFTDLPADETPAALKTILDIITRTTDPNALYQLAWAARPLTGRAPPNDRKAAAALRRLAGSMVDAGQTGAAEQLALLADAVGGRLSADETSREATEAIRKALEAMDSTTDGPGLAVHAQTIARLAPRLAPDETTKARTAAVNKLLDALEKKTDETDINYLAGAVAQFARDLPPQEVVNAGRRLVAFMDRDAHNTPIRRLFLWGRVNALIPLLARMPRAEAERTAAATVRVLFIAIDRSDVVYDRTNWVDLVAALAPFAASEQALADARRGFAVLEKDSANNNYFGVRACENWAARLPPDEVVPAARRLIERMDNPTQTRILTNYSVALAALAPRLPPNDAGAMATAATRKLLAAMDAPNSRWNWYDLASALLRVTPWLPPEEAAPVTQRVLVLLEETTNQGAPGVVVQGGADTEFVRVLLLTAGHLPPQEAAAAARKLVELQDRTANGSLLMALPRLVPRLATEDLLDLFKDPTCVRDARAVVMSELARRLGPPAETAVPDAAAIVVAPPPVGLNAAAWLLQGEAVHPSGLLPFADRWQAVVWIREHHPAVDIASPPRRPDR